jgi:hypothetical protein
LTAFKKSIFYFIRFTALKNSLEESVLKLLISAFVEGFAKFTAIPEFLEPAVERALIEFAHDAAQELSVALKLLSPLAFTCEILIAPVSLYDKLRSLTVFATKIPFY